MFGGGPVGTFDSEVVSQSFFVAQMLDVGNIYLHFPLNMALLNRSCR